MCQGGGILRSIDGLGIDELLASELPRTCASHPSAAIERAVARLLERRERGTSIELTLARDNHEGHEQHVSVSVTVA